MQTAKGMGVDPYYLMDRQAERAPIGANRLVYLPYLMGERSPKLDSDCRGVFFGLSAMHTKYDMLRAVMEGVIYSQRECLDILRGMGVVSSEMLACGGGGSSPMWRQMMADVYNLPVKTVVSKEGPALGVAILAGVGAGIYSSVAEACRKVVKTNPAQAPIPESTGRYEGLSYLLRPVSLAEGLLWGAGCAMNAWRKSKHLPRPLLLPPQFVFNQMNKKQAGRFLPKDLPRLVSV